MHPFSYERPTEVAQAVALDPQRRERVHKGGTTMQET
jgi:hypothetical protein